MTEPFGARLEDIRPELCCFLSWLCWRYHLPADQVEDLMQEATLRVIRSSQQDGNSQEGLVHRMRTISNNIAVDLVRKLAREKRALRVVARSLTQEYAPETPDQEEMSTAEWVCKLVKILPKADAILLGLLVIDKLNYEQIAERLGISKSAAYQRCHRLKERLRKRLDPNNA